MSFSEILAIPKGTKIKNYVVKGPGRSRGEPALVYLIPNNKSGKPNEKRIRQSEWEAAFQYIKTHEQFTLEAFRKTMPDAAKDGECNFHFTWYLLLHLARKRQKRSLSKTPVASPKKGMLLIPELIPKALWGRSAFRMFNQRAIWTKQIRPEALAQANQSCELCAVRNERLICHDKWQYDDKKTTATLIGFEIHCPDCDAVTHFGLAVNRGDRGALLLMVLNHLCAVNQCTMEDAERLLVNSLEEWSIRNKMKWKITVVPPLLTRYPELERLPTFLPPSEEHHG